MRIGGLVFKNIKEDQAIRFFSDRTSANIEEEVFKSLVEHLAKVLDAKDAWLTEYIEEQNGSTPSHPFLTVAGSITMLFESPARQANWPNPCQDMTCEARRIGYRSMPLYTGRMQI